MANIALYRRYRPKTFDEVVGQEHVTEPLIAALRNGKLNHAYLFSGPRGCGKTSSARILARSVNCAQGPTPTPCGECESCRALAPDGPGSIDVIEIDAASHGGVDDARELREKAFFAPVSSRYKVYVIDEAHMVSSAGFNALLKLVEEPPEYVMFVFATTEPDKVLGTIKSRTHHYPFRLVPPGVLRGHLERVCAAEGVKVDPLVFPLVVRSGGGSVRDSMSVLDQLLSGAGEDGVTYQSALRLLGVTDVGLIDQTCDALAASNGAQLFAAVDSVVEAGHDPRRFAADLLERLRDLIVLNQVPEAAGKGLLDVPADELERMSAQANRLGPATLSRMADILHEGLTTMRGATSPRLVLELLCARMLLPGDESAADLMQRMERLERRLDIAASAHPAPAAPPAAGATAAPPAAAPPAPAVEPVARPGGGDAQRAASPPAPTPVSPAGGGEPAATGAPAPEGPAGAEAPAATSPEPAETTPAATAPTSPASAASAGPAAPAPPVQAVPAGGAGVLDVGAVVAAWEQVVEHTKSRRRLVWSLLQNAAPYELDGDMLILNTRSPGLVSRFNDDAVVSVLQDALFDVLGVRWRIRCQSGGSGGGGGTGRPGPSPTSGGPAGPAHPGGPGNGDGPAGSSGSGESGATPGVPRQAAGPARSPEHTGQAGRPDQPTQTGQAPAQTGQIEIEQAQTGQVQTGRPQTEQAQTGRAQTGWGQAGPVQAGQQQGAAGESDWPETARPGGVAVTTETVPSDPAPTGTTSGGTGAVPGGPGSGGPGSGGAGSGGAGFGGAGSGGAGFGGAGFGGARASGAGSGGAGAGGAGSGGAGAGGAGFGGARASGAGSGGAAAGGAGVAGGGVEVAGGSVGAVSGGMDAGGVTAPVGAAPAGTELRVAAPVVVGSAASGGDGRVGDGYGLPDGPTDFSPDDPVPAGAPRGTGYDEVDPGDELLDEPAPDVPPPASVEELAGSLFQDVLGAQPIKGIGG